MKRKGSKSAKGNTAAGRGARRVTDRALRYRAQKNAPDGPKLCYACGSKRNILLDHINGLEEDSDGCNLMWYCKACNTAKGFAFRRAGVGRLTSQLNPAKSKYRGARTMGQWALAHLSVQGKSDAMTVGDAAEMIRATPDSRRKEFASEIWRRRRARGSDTWASTVPF